MTHLSVIKEQVKSKDADLDFYVLDFDILALPRH